MRQESRYAANNWDQTASFLAGGAGKSIPAQKIIETHAAKIFLIGDLAYKIKKPVDLGYLDFSTADKRRRALEREFERNRVFDTDLYLEVSAIRRDADGVLRLGSQGEPVEYVLVMRRFADNALLSDNVTRVEGLFAEALGRRIAQIHSAALPMREAWPLGFEYAIRSNADRLMAFKSDLSPNDTEMLVAKTDNTYRSQSEMVGMRGRMGFVRRCHGDLHLGNIFVEDDHAVLFDCIEFDDRMSDIDVLYDIAFLLMDMVHKGQMEGTNRLFNAYLDGILRHFDEDFLTGLSLMPLFLSMRAAVRTHVSAQMGRIEEARTYLHAALQHLASREATLTAVGGLSGTGKTRFARERAPRIGRVPGAVVLRSDEIRKRLWKVQPFERLPAAAYTAEESQRVYEVMHREAGSILHTGHSVILDAVYLQPRERAECAEVAKRVGVPFEGFWLEASADVLRQRLSSRRDDASDAGVEVLERQLRRDPGRIDWKRINSSQQG